MPHLPRKKLCRTCGNYPLTVRRWPPVWSRRPFIKKGRAFLPARIRSQSLRLDVENSHDLVRVRIDYYDLLLDPDEPKSSPFRIDRDDSVRQRMEAHVARNAGADRE